MSMTTVPVIYAENLPRRKEPAGNLATNFLKIIALFFMFIDHSGKVLFNDMQEMRMLGRIAFPIYLWCMVVGFCRTRCVWKYMLRVFLVGLVSQPLYVLALDMGAVRPILRNVLISPLANGGWASVDDVLYRIFLYKPNIFLTLLLGLGALWGIREKKYLSQIWAPAAAICLATVLGADYGWKGVALLILLYAVRDTRSGIAAVMIAFMLFWGTSYRVTSSIFGMTFDVKELPAFISSPLSAFMRMETYGLLALPVILWRFQRDVRMPRWLGYALYPGHLAVIIVLKIVFFGW